MRIALPRMKPSNVVFAHQSRSLIALVLAALLLCWPPPSTQAAAGELDASFGIGGKVVTSLSDGPDFASAIAIQPDGKIVVAGQAEIDVVRHYNGFAIARYNPDGSLDTSFGVDGKVVTDLGPFDSARAVAIQADGKIVAAGYARLTSIYGIITGGDFALARYNPDGSLDTTFGSTGKIKTHFNEPSEFGHVDQIQAIAVQSDGRIVVAGDVLNSASQSVDFAVLRYDSSGNPDPSFGSTGRAITDIGALDSAKAIALQADGRIVVAGQSYMSSTFDFVVARYNANGSLDASFGSGGKTVTDFGSDDTVYAVTVQSDGRIIAAGSSAGNFALARYNTNGGLDFSFGSSGKVSTDFFGTTDIARAIALQQDGRIVAAGESRFTLRDTNFAVARYDAGTVEGDFSLSTSKGIQYVNVGESKDFSVFVEPTGGPPTTSSVQLSATVTPPAGEISMTFLPASVGIGGASVLTVTPSANTPLGIYFITITASSGRIARSASLLTQVLGPDFQIGVFNTVVATRGSQVRVRVEVRRYRGFTGQITVTPPDLSGVGITFKPSERVSTSDGAVKFKMKVADNTPPLIREVNFVGKDESGRVHTAMARIEIH